MNPMNKIGQIYLRTNIHIKFSAPFFLLQLMHNIYISDEREQGEFLTYPFFLEYDIYM